MEKTLMKNGSKVDIIYVKVTNTNFKTTKENAMMLNTNIINIMQEARVVNREVKPNHYLNFEFTKHSK
jgi:hypothetical protein